MFDIGVSAFCDQGMNLKNLEKASGIECRDLKALTRVIDFYFERWGKQAVALKNVCAYWRPLFFEEWSYEAADAAFQKWLKSGEKLSFKEIKPMQDYCFHHCIQRAVDYGLTVKVHTGYLSGNNYQDLSLYQIKDMVNLFRKYPGARFNLIHMAWPEERDLLSLSKHYSNVYADLAWAWVIDPESCINFLKRALVTLTINKVHGFGGDYGYADVVYGHCRIARDGISLVLGEAVQQGLLSLPEAKRIASAWLRDNAMQNFQMESRRKIQAQGQPEPLKMN
jgi:hypothetical protein